MPYTIVDDGDEINIRATITQRWELAELVAKLQQRVDGLPVNLTTMIDDPAQAQTVRAFVSKEDVQHAFDAQDVNRKELSNER